MVSVARTIERVSLGYVSRAFVNKIALLMQKNLIDRLGHVVQKRVNVKVCFVNLVNVLKNTQCQSRGTKKFLTGRL
jgi:hypothetical protein